MKYKAGKCSPVRQCHSFLSNINGAREGFSSTCQQCNRRAKHSTHTRPRARGPRCRCFCWRNHCQIILRSRYFLVSSLTPIPYFQKTILEGVHRHFRKGSSVASPRLDRKLSCSSSYGNILEQSHLSFFKLGYQYVSSLLQV